MATEIMKASSSIAVSDLPFRGSCQLVTVELISQLVEHCTMISEGKVQVLPRAKVFLALVHEYN